MSENTALHAISLVGFGEAGSILGEELAKAGRAVRTFDILIGSPGGRTVLAARARAAGVGVCETLADAVRGADLLISAVTATAARDVAREAASLMKSGQLFMDINSVSPETRRGNAQLIESCGADYVEAAVMAPVPPLRLRVPMLLGGRRAADLAVRLRDLGMNATAVSGQVGVASAIKMCRSIMIKGIEALTTECLFAARRHGAEDAVLESLHSTFPSMGWNAALPDYLISRVAEHGRRRAAEMREVARTLQDVGIDPLMASATADRQQWMVDEMQVRGMEYDADRAFAWREWADRMRS